MACEENSVFIFLVVSFWEGLGRRWKESVLCHVLVLVWRTVCLCARHSAVCRGLNRAGQGIQDRVRASVVCRALAREGAVVRAWPSSIFCKLVSGVVNIPCALFKWLYKIARKQWDASVVFRVLSAVGGAASVPLGILMLIMLCAPHAVWDNLYAFAGAMLVTVLFLAGCMNRSRQRFQAERLGPYMAVYAIFICYGLVRSFSISMSARFFVFHVTCALIVLLMVSSITKYRQLKVAVVLVGAGLLIAALYGCYQGYVGVPVVVTQQDLSVNAGMPGRVYSFFDNPNNFAEILVMLTPLMLALLINARTVVGRLLALAAVGTSVASIGFTLSRSGWIGLAAAVVLFCAFQNWRLVPVLLLLGVLAIPFLPKSIYNRILTIGNMNDTSTLYRFSIYEVTGKLLKDFGLRGVGLGNDVMGRVFRLYPAMYDGNYPIHTHNNYLQMWAEVGFFGLLAYLGVILGHLKAGIKAFAASTDKRLKHMLAAAVSAMCGILIISFVEYTWFYPRNMFLFWFLFAVIAVCIKLSRKPEEAA